MDRRDRPAIQAPSGRTKAKRTATADPNGPVDIDGVELSLPDVSNNLGRVYDSDTNIALRPTKESLLNPRFPEICSTW